MTVSSTSNRVSYSGNGVTTAFSFPYYFQSSSDLVVVLRSTSGTETTKTITTHYTVSGTAVNSVYPSGGTVTMITPPASGEYLIIYRDPSATQSLDLVENDALPAESVEQAFDKAAMLNQRTRDLITRSVRLSDGDVSGVSTTLPTPSALRALRWNSGVTALENYDPASVSGASFPGSNGLAVYLGSSAFTARTLTAGTGISVSNGDGVGGNPTVTLAIPTSSLTAFEMAGAAFSPEDRANLGLAASVGSNALTINLVQASGSTASSSAPVKIAFRGTAANSGAVNVRSVTGALSVVVSSGSTLGHASGVTHYIYVYAIDNAGTVELAVSTSFFDEGTLVSTTAEGGAGAADSAAVLYSTTARASVPCRLIGRLKVNQATAGTWASAPTEIVVGNVEKIGPFASYWGNAATSCSNAGTSTINFDTKLEDTFNSVTNPGSAWTFTAPMPGVYEISSQVGSASGGGWASGEVWTVSAFKNGSGLRVLGEKNSDGAHTNPVMAGGTTSARLAVGDTITIRVFQSSGASLNTANANQERLWVDVKWISF